VPRDAVVFGPLGAVPVLREGAASVVHLEHVGSYRVSGGGREQVRHVAFDEAEVLGEPATLRSHNASVGPRPVLRDRSPWVVALLLAALGLELALRFRLRPRRGLLS
jgi:hypothetical protein